MNIFKNYQKDFSLLLNELNKKKIIIFNDSVKNLTVEPPPKNFLADMSCNAALILSKLNKTTPDKLSKIIKIELLKKFKEFQNIEISKQGFLNITFQIDFWNNYLIQLISLKKDFGSSNDKELKYNLEFVSANPTGPLHVGHCRGAILGDVIANLLKFNGHLVTKEYYVNDYGSQIKNFVTSVHFRILELLKIKKFPVDSNLYPGDYIIEIAKNIINKKIIKDYSNLDDIYEILSKESLSASMELIKNNLNLLGVKHDVFVHETELVKNKLVSKTINKLKKEEFVYIGKLDKPKGDTSVEWESRDQLLFKSTKFGDDVDRALMKNDDTWTYFASDIAYHDHKIRRNFDLLINILGADHSGYIKRIKAATKALSNGNVNLICKVSRLVKLFKDGKPFKMSKRKGDYITVEDLIHEVGKDSARFMMLNRSNDVELDFDFKKVSEKSKDNPIFYIQYAYARINSIFRILKLELNIDLNIKKNELNFNNYEIEILKKMSEWPKCVEISSTKLEPHRIPFYLYELVTLFHSYWNLGNDNKEFRFINNKGISSTSKLALLQALSIVIKNGMTILGVSTPSSM
jgi:arginyl-tRNA synthetase